MPTTLKIQNVNTYIYGNFPREIVDIALSYYPKGFFMSPKYSTCLKCNIKFKYKKHICESCGRPRVWDGRIRFLKGGKKGTPYFPTGLLSVVVTVLTQMSYKHTFVDERIKPSSFEAAPPEAAYSVKLVDRDLWAEQQDAIHAALLHERGIIQSPTASGKTSIMAGILKLVQLPSLVFIHNTTIANQLRKELQMLMGEPVGLIKQDVFDIQRVTVTMTQSLLGHLSLDKESKEKEIPPLEAAVKLAQNTRLLMFDEAHHGSSKTWSVLANYLINAYYRLGVTGTAFMRPSGDDLILVGVTGGLIYEASEQSLIEQGKIAQPIIHLYAVNEPGNINKLSYQAAYDKGVVNNDYINLIATKSIKNLAKQKQQILVLCERLEHIQNLSKLLTDTKHTILTGDTPSNERDEAKEEFADGKIQIIIASNIFDEGVSINNIDYVFRMGLMRTPIKTKQQVGRGQRKKKDKPNIVHIVDWMHDTHENLREHSLEHFKQYTSLHYPIIVETEALVLRDS